MYITLLILLVSFHVNPIYSDCTSPPCIDYYERRTALINLDSETHFDKNIHLNEKEIAVDKLMSSLRQDEITDYNGRFIFSDNFRDIKPKIENSKVFALLKRMPKGGLLHTHGIGDPWFLFMNGTYDPECWVNVGNGTDEYPSFSFTYSSQKPPEPTGTQWVNVVQMRSISSNPEQFDKDLFSLVQFYTPNDTVTENAMWENFNLVIRRVCSLGGKEVIYWNFVTEAINNLVEDGVTHFEIRGFMEFIQNTNYTPNDYMSKWLNLLQSINSKLPASQQISVRFINVRNRRSDEQTIWDGLLQTAELQQGPYADYVVGFDIVDEEDRYNTLRFYLEDWLNIEQYLQNKNWPQIKYYFHTGETDWDKFDAANLYDSLLLNTTRIGHGFALKYYPFLMKETIKNGIAIEVCPISNQMLQLIYDMRDHPALEFLNNGLYVTISNDDPLVFGNTGLSYDYWAAYMSWNITLNGLKQLTINGIQFSSLPDNTKTQKLQQLDTLWGEWIDDVLDNFM